MKRVFWNSCRALCTTPAALRIRRAVYEIGCGLLMAWVALMALELMRAGSVSLYLDMNMLLAIGAVTWLIGKNSLQ